MFILRSQRYQMMGCKTLVFLSLKKKNVWFFFDVLSRIRTGRGGNPTKGPGEAKSDSPWTTRRTTRPERCYIVALKATRGCSTFLSKACAKFGLLLQTEFKLYNVRCTNSTIYRLMQVVPPAASIVVDVDVAAVAAVVVDVAAVVLRPERGLLLDGGQVRTVQAVGQVRALLA